MRRRFNTTGACNPQRHYMVRLDDRVKKIREDYVDEGSYFVINRGRQYGKTTTLKALKKCLSDEYIVLATDFQRLGTREFSDEPTFVCAFAEILIEALEINGLDGREELTAPLAALVGRKDNGLKNLFVRLSSMCRNSSRPIVLMIDEVDSASNNQVFIDFLGQLRSYYLNREEMPIFHSVILAGVYRVKNIHFSPGKFVQGHKFANNSLYEHQYNSPWNIAADFNIDMSFSVEQIAGMLEEYDEDKHIALNIKETAEEIFQYTSGYPVLVSNICKQLDENILGKEGFETLQKVWTKEGVARAVDIILKKSSPLFEHMAKQLDTYKELHNMIEDIIYRGKRITFSPEHKFINLGIMFGFLKETDGHVVIANRMFEMCLLNLFMAEESESDIYSQGGSDRIGFIKNNMLDMDMVLKKFVEHFTEICSQKDDKFVEKYGRKFFLLYLKPIINGTGNYYIEAQTRDERRTDVIVDYLGEQFIIELKIWHGSEYNERGERQLTEYLEYYHKDKGYMLSFNFNQNKKIGVNTVRVGGRTIVEAVV